MPKKPSFTVVYQQLGDPRRHHVGPFESLEGAKTAGQRFYDRGAVTKIVDERGSRVHEFS